jgi:hypothetical protein
MTAGFAAVRDNAHERVLMKGQVQEQQQKQGSEAAAGVPGGCFFMRSCRQPLHGTGARRYGLSPLQQQPYP